MTSANYYSEEHKAQIFEIRTLADIFNLPTIEDVKNCLHDIGEAMLIARHVNDTLSKEFGSAAVYPEVTKWINDGKHENVPNFVVQVEEAPEPVKSIEDRVREILVDHLDLDPVEIAADSEFITDLGADSLDVLELMLSFEEEFSIEIPDADAEKIVTVNDLVVYIDAATY